MYKIDKYEYFFRLYKSLSNEFNNPCSNFNKNNSKVEVLLLNMNDLILCLISYLKNFIKYVF